MSSTQDDSDEQSGSDEQRQQSIGIQTDVNMMNMAQANTNTKKRLFSCNSMYIITAILIICIIIMLTTLSLFFMLRSYHDLSLRNGYSSMPVSCKLDESESKLWHTSKDIQKYLKLLKTEIVSKRYRRILKEHGREKRRLALYKWKERINYFNLLKHKQVLEQEVADLKRKKREILQEEAMTSDTQAAKEKGTNVLSKEPGLVCNNRNRVYNCLLCNTSLEIQGANYIDISIKLKLLRNNSADNGHVLFEFGLVSKSDKNDRYSCLYSVKFRRCDRELGVCLEIQDELSTKLMRNMTESTHEYFTIKYTIKVQHSFVVLLNKAQITHISTLQNASEVDNLWPAVFLYNPHIVDASLSISSENNIEFDRKSSSPHLYLSLDNKTVSNWARIEATNLLMLYLLEMVFNWISIFIVIVICTTETDHDRRLTQLLLPSTAMLGSAICLYYCYCFLYWSLLLFLIVVLCNILFVRPRRLDDMSKVPFNTFLTLQFITLLTSVIHMIYSLYINFIVVLIS